MEIWLFLLTILVCIVCTITVVVRLAIRKPVQKLVWVIFAAFTLAGGSSVWMADSRFSNICIFLGMWLVLLSLILVVPLVICRVRKRKTKILKFVMPGYLICGILLFAASFWISGSKQTALEKDRELHQIEPITDVDFDVIDGIEPIELKPYTEISGSATATDSAYYDKVLGTTDATAENCKQAIAENLDIPNQMKTYFTDFVNRIETKYPGIDYQILYHNLKTLKVMEVPKNKFYTKSLSVDSYGVYIKNENAIYIPEGTHYVEGEWGFQVLLHEFCHAARSCWNYSEDGNHVSKTIFQQPPSSGEGDLLEEAMNSVFSCSLLNYYERDIAYQIPSNYLRIILDCMDYDMRDYISKSDAYFYRTLDEYTGYTNYAHVIWKLIALQRSDWENEKKIDLPAEKYYPIYDYLCEMYYKKYITPDMTPEEAKAVADELVDKAFYDAPEGYKITPQRMYDNLELYLEEQSDQQTA